jgi:hypothetical protein
MEVCRIMVRWDAQDRASGGHNESSIMDGKAHRHQTHSHRGQESEQCGQTDYYSLTIKT